MLLLYSVFFLFNFIFIVTITNYTIWRNKFNIEIFIYKQKAQNRQENENAFFFFNFLKCGNAVKFLLFFFLMCLHYKKREHQLGNSYKSSHMFHGQKSFFFLFVNCIIFFCDFLYYIIGIKFFK